MLRHSTAASRGPVVLRGTILIVAFGFLLSQLGCTTLWDRVRENERMSALKSARTQTGRGQCAKGLVSLDRAQARYDLGAYSRESTIARTRCYEKLGLTERAAAHRRLITDFYTNEPMAYPEAGNASVFRVKTVSDAPIARPPTWLEISEPYYSPYARRSKIVGRVIVSFEIAGNDRPRKIRVLEMGHPLLATWAIDAIASANPSKRKMKGSPELAPGTQFITTFVFTYRWAGEEENQPGDS